MAYDKGGGETRETDYGFGAATPPTSPTVAAPRPKRGRSQREMT